MTARWNDGDGDGDGGSTITGGVRSRVDVVDEATATFTVVLVGGVVCRCDAGGADGDPGVVSWRGGR